MGANLPCISRVPKQRQSGQTAGVYTNPAHLEIRFRPTPSVLSILSSWICDGSACRSLLVSHSSVKNVRCHTLKTNQQTKATCWRGVAGVWQGVRLAPLEAVTQSSTRTWKKRTTYEQTDRGTWRLTFKYVDTMARVQ